MNTFETAGEAQAFVRDKVDIAVAEQEVTLRAGVEFHAFSHELTDGRFSNVYDVSYRRDAATPVIYARDQLSSVYDFSRENDRSVATVSGGFFLLADQYGGLPRQLALNLAVAQGRLLNLPVVDREAVLISDRELTATKIKALGELTINGVELSWAGSLTDHAADCSIFGNGNAVITNQYSEATGTMRVLDESSRYTPMLEDGDLIDVGFIAQEDGSFIEAGSSKNGVLDVFGYDVVVRCAKAKLPDDDVLRLQIHTVDGLRITEALQGALSVGPLLDEADFVRHGINQDLSLGAKPPFLERPLARTVLYETTEGVVHMRLFDGRPDSETFPGVTPSQVVAIIRKETDIIWGCFLDPGQTAKLTVRNKEEVSSHGNRHYIKWPTRPGEKYVWVPEHGRPVASVIAIQ